jgi:hypothetical protein
MYHFVYDGHREQNGNDGHREQNGNDGHREHDVNRGYKKEKFLTEEEEKIEYNRLMQLKNVLDNVEANINAKNNNDPANPNNDMEGILKVLYGSKYIDYINKGNAIAYNQYKAFGQQDKNKMYQSLMRT